VSEGSWWGRVSGGMQVTMKISFLLEGSTAVSYLHSAGAEEGGGRVSGRVPVTLD
jgi:hypothetical protein